MAVEEKIIKLISGDNPNIQATVSTVGAVNALEVTGSVFPVGGILSGIAYDYVSINYSGTTSDVYTFKTGGSGGTTVATITLGYTDSGKGTLSTVTKI